MPELGATFREPAAAESAAAGQPPSIWLLLGSRAGDRAQVEALGRAVGQALGWPCVPKRIVSNGLFRLPNLLLDSSLASIDRARSDRLTPPWPALVVAAGRRAVPAARWVRRQSGGRARLVHIGRPWAPLSWFDLVVTTPQYALPSRPNVLRNSLPLSGHAPGGDAAAAAAHWKPRLEHLPRPWIAVLVGGAARPFHLDPGTAARLGSAASAMAQACGGSLLVATSPRTPPGAADALTAALAAPHFLHRWQPGGDNPYPAFLALADRFVVTGDSASMLAEACAAGASRGAPVEVFELPERPDLRLWVARAWGRAATQGDGLRRLYDRLVDLGLLTSTRDMTAFHRTLYDRGLAIPFGAPRPAAAAQLRDELAATVNRICALVRHSQGTSQ